MALAAIRLIDLAIFGTLGTLWIGGLLFIVALYRWIRRYEHAQGTDSQVRPPTPAVEPTPIRLAPVASPPAAARASLVAVASRS